MAGTLLVTGGAGFIGSNFVRLVAKTRPVVVLDKLTYAGSLESLADVPGDPRFVFVLVDIADRDTVASVVRKYRPASLKYRDNPEALAVLDEERKEIDMYRRSSQWYGSAFFVLQKE